MADVGSRQRAALARVILGCAAALAACGGSALLPDGPAVRTRAPIELDEVVYEGFTNGARGLRVVGKQASIDAGGAFARLDEVGIALANSERGEVSIRAGRAMLDLAREDVVLEGGVQGTTRAGEHFRTERVRFDRARDELASDGPVELERRGLRVQADGMRLDVEGRRLVLRGSVRTRLEPGGAGG